MLVLGGDRSVRALDLESGEESWRVAPLIPEGDMECREGTGERAVVICDHRPAPYDPSLELGGVGRIERRDAATGEILDEVVAAPGQRMFEWDDELLVLEDLDGATEVRLESFAGEVSLRPLFAKRRQHDLHHLLIVR